MLNIVTPVSRHDIHLLENRVRLFTKFGGFARHQITFVPTKEVSGEIGGAVEACRSLTNHVTVMPMDHTPTGGWPDACNSHFVNTVYGLGKTKNPNFWYFMELDVTPTRPNWQDLLETDRNIHGAVLMGSVVNTRKLNPQGEPFTEEWDTHMVGAAIYPPEFYKIVHWLRQMQKGVAFDVQIRHECRRLFYNSPLFQHMWGTVNYRVEQDGSISCEDDPKNPPHTGHAGVCRMDAVVIHGCKDGSLARLILDDKVIFTEGKKPIAAVTVVESEAPGKVAGAIPLDSGLVKFDMGLGTKMPDPIPATDPVSEEIPSKPEDFELGTATVEEDVFATDPSGETEATQTVTTSGESPTLLDRAKEEFAKGNNRIHTLAEAIGANKDELKTTLIGAGAKISGPGWVKWSMTV